MKQLLTSSFLAVLLLAATPCFALWGLAPITKVNAKEMGVEFRTTQAGPESVRMELEFKTDGAFKNYSRVELRVGEEGKQVISAIKEDQKKDGKVIVSFAAARSQVDQVQLWIMVPGSLGGTAYVINAKEFVEPAKGK